MKLRHISLLLMLAWGLNLLIATPCAADPSPASSNGTNEVQAAKPPGALYTNSIGMELLKVSGGVWAGKFEVTQSQFQKVMQYNPSAFPGPTHPVDSVNYNDAVEFCRRMTDLDLKKQILPKGYYYTLPTEDEWAGLVADANLKDAVTSLNGATRSGTSPVGSLSPNSLGLYDTRGNVMEFCLADASKPYRVLKGGSWHDFVEVNLRPEFRWYCQPDDRQNTFGFRCLLKNGGGK